MAKISIVLGLLLSLLGMGFYVGIGIAADKSPSVTALIPAFAGVPILLAGLLALKESYRMHAMHLVASLAMLGFLAPVLRLVMQLARGAEIKSIVLIELTTMALLCGLLLGLCVKSFIDARRRRSETPS